MANDYVQQVAGSIIEQLKQGAAPWVKPWKPGERFMPYNPTSGNDYHGMNALWLLSVAQARGYGDARWMTYRQAQAQGAQVGRGEKGTVIQYWKWQGLEPVLNANGEPVLDENDQPKQERVCYERPHVWSAVVFNAAQIDGLPPVPERVAITEWERHERAEAILKASGADIGHEAGDRAFYSLTYDRITLPERVQFPTQDGYYATALHELGHWSGHPSRLNRDLAHPFGSGGYAKEELRAEIASLMLGEQLGIGHDPGSHTAYIKSWIKVLEDDPREIFRAAADAEKIVRHLRGLEQPQEQQQNQEQRQNRESATSEQSADNTVQIQTPVLVHDTEVAVRTNNGRVYLAVPYSEKDDAKALGAKWDREAKAWYAPSGVDQTPLERWLPGHQDVHVDVTRDPRAEFASALREAGLQLNGLPQMDGELRRVPVVGDKPGEHSGAYVGFLDGHPAGYLHNYKTGLETPWKSRNRSGALSTRDRVRLAAEAAQRRQQRAKERERRYEETARAVEARWAAAVPVTEHPYLAEKGVPSYGLRQDNAGNLLVPVRDAEGKLWSLQSINTEGRKSFETNGRVHGCYSMIGHPGLSPVILVAEGYATSATVHQATDGLAVAVAFHSGNLTAVAQALREHYPDKPLYIAGDNDHPKEREGRQNVGREKAEEAARLVGGTLLLPQFTTADPGTDWNDLAKSLGLIEVQQQLKTGMAIAERHERSTERGRLASIPRQNEDRGNVQSISRTGEPQAVGQSKQRGGRRMAP